MVRKRYYSDSLERLTGKSRELEKLTNPNTVKMLCPLVRQIRWAVESKFNATVAYRLYVGILSSHLHANDLKLSPVGLCYLMLLHAA